MASLSLRQRACQLPQQRAERHMELTRRGAVDCLTAGRRDAGGSMDALDCHDVDPGEVRDFASRGLSVEIHSERLLIST